MTDLIPVPALTPVPQLETNTLALAGTGNPMNAQAQALANRDAFRGEQIAGILTSANGYTDQLRQDLVEPINGSINVWFRNRTVFAKLDDMPSVMDFEAVGDGVTDDTQAFIDAFAARDSVFVPEGEFLVGDVVLQGKRIYGNGTIIKKSASTTALTLSGNGSEVIGLNFRPQSTSGQPNTDIKLADGATNIRITGNHFFGDCYSAIYGATDLIGSPYAVPVNGVNISNNVFEAKDKVSGARYARHIYLKDVSNINISGNIFRDSAFDAIRLRGRNGYCTITGNSFTDIGIYPPPDDQTRDAVDTYWGGDLLIVSNNTIKGVAMIGLDLKLSARAGIDAPEVVGERTRQFIVSNNIIDTVWKAGIIVAGDDISLLPLYSCIIEGNLIRKFNQSAIGTGSGQSGIDVKFLARHVKINNNIIQEGLARGIFVEMSTTYLDVIGNSVINNADAGVVLSEAENMKIVHNTICQDTNIPGSGSQNIGILISNLTGIAKTAIFSFNIIKDNQTVQVSLSPTGNRFTTFAQIVGNIESGPGLMATSYPRTGQSRRIMHGSAIPVASDGTFEVGDIVYNVAPAGGGFMGWTCTVAGSPGTWKTFGVISV